MDNLTRRLAGYAASLSFDELPPEVVRKTTQHLVDTLASAIPAYECEPARIGRRLARGIAPERYPGRILGFGERSSADAASFVNTTMIRNLELNDAYVGGHPSDCLGALLALAEAAEVDGRRLLTAMAVAYETFTRLSDAARLRQRGWDQGFALGIGTAAAVGHLFRLSFEQIAHGIAITAVANAPMRATRAGQLSLWKGAATAYAVRNAVFGVLLAAEGMTGPDQPFEGRHGLWEQITGPFEIGELGGRGGEFRLLTVRQKYWPVEGGAQAAVWAARDVRALVEIDDIDEIVIWAAWTTWHEIGSEPEKWDPRTRETADHSLPYIFARALVDGTVNLETFSEESYLDPALRPLMARIRVELDETLETQQASSIHMRVLVKTKSGASYSLDVAHPLGHWLNPMGEAETTTKFETYARPVYGEGRTRALLQRWWKVGELESLTDALDLLDQA